MENLGVPLTSPIHQPVPVLYAVWPWRTLPPDPTTIDPSVAAIASRELTLIFAAVMVPAAICVAVIVPAAMSDAVMVPAAIFAPVMESALSLVAVMVAAAIFAAVTVFAAICVAVMVPVVMLPPEMLVMFAPFPESVPAIVSVVPFH